MVDTGSAVGTTSTGNNGICEFATDIVGFGLWGAIVSGCICPKYFRFRNVRRPEPSTLTTYWSFPFTLTTRPVLSHFLGKRPFGFVFCRCLPPVEEIKHGFPSLMFPPA